MKPVLVWLVPMLAACATTAGCGGAREAAGAQSPSDPNHLPISIEHEACDEKSASAEKIDTNSDGVPDIVRVTSGGRETCRMVDLNHDGRPDAYIYSDDNGQIRRRESDFDRDGKIDEIAHFSGGVVTRKDRETNLDGKFDTWDFYESGKLVRRSRDSDGDGKIDQWWTWSNPDKPECPVIASDRDGDGKPEPANVIDVCAPAPVASTGAPAPAGATSSAPVANAAPTAPSTPTASPTTAAAVTPAAGTGPATAPSSQPAQSPSAAPAKAQKSNP